jgi:diguanylate cyclase (GGDEF)-like protein
MGFDFDRPALELPPGKNLPSLSSGLSGSASPRVLLAEDDTATRLILQCWLGDNGFEIVVANDGNEAWSILEQAHPPEILILDWTMPGIDGIELCRKVRNKDRAYYPYVLMIAARNEKQDVAHALESGADDYLVKPFSKSDLRARLGVAKRIFTLQDGLIRAREQLRLEATKDSLTGLFNRAAFLDLFGRELSRAGRSRSSTGFLLMDLDKFKVVNDTYGHLIGDHVLRETAQRITQNVRAYDLVGRYGGEEFCVVLPDCSMSQVRERAETIRASFADEPLRVGTGTVPITLSIGATAASADAGSISSMIATADVGLYRAKSAGRNRTVFCEKRWDGVTDSLETTVARCADCEFLSTEKCVVAGSELSRLRVIS